MTVADDLNALEQQVRDAFPRGIWVDPAAPDHPAGGCPDLTVRAEVITRLLLGPLPPAAGHLPGLRLAGVRITGAMDLRDATVDTVVVIERCSFDEPPQCAGLTVRSLRIRQCRLPGFDGVRMRVPDQLDLAACVVSGGVRLDRARIEGDLCLRGTALNASADGLALSGDGMTVGGGLDCGGGFTADGGISLKGLRIDGPVIFSGARITCPGGDALNIDRAVVNDRVRAARLTVAGRFRLFNATIAGSVRLSGARLSHPGGMALGAGGATVRGGFWCSQSFTAEGEVRLIGAELRANLCFDDAVLSNHTGPALTLDGARLGEFEASRMTVTHGPVSLIGTRVDGSLRLDGARLGRYGEPTAFDAEGAAIAGSVYFQDLRADAAVRLRGAVVAGRVLFTGARLTVREGVALDVRGLQAAELSLRTTEPVPGSVLLERAHLGLLRDDPERWPARLALEGLRYAALSPPSPAADRLRWLARDPTGYRPGPYEELAASYVRSGELAQARHVLYAKERGQHAAGSLLGRVWGAAQDMTIGYGYRPWRALPWLGLLVGAGSAIYRISPPAALNPAQAPHFNPVVYTTDLLLPVVDLGQASAFDPSGGEQWFSYLLVTAGWILVTTVAAGVARALTRPDPRG